MNLKAIIFLLVSTLFVSTNVSSLRLAIWEVSIWEILSAPTSAPAAAPALSPKPSIPMNTSECPRLCGERCRLHVMKQHCSQTCVTCCQQCKCVPPGAYGNKEKCGECYTGGMYIHGNAIKCP